jgi:hypothetical protein
MSTVETFAISLNGAFGVDPQAAADFFSRLQSALRSRAATARPATVRVQVSFDEYHQEICIDRHGRFHEKIPVAAIANLLLAARHAPEIEVHLLHKQNPFNFSIDLIEQGVFARLRRAFDDHRIPVQIVRVACAPRPHADPVRIDQPPRPLICTVEFALASHPDRLFQLNSSWIDGYGRAGALDPGEYVANRDVLTRLLDGTWDEEARRQMPFDTSPMCWYDGRVTLFSAAHVTLGNMDRDSVQVLVARHAHDPLLRALERFDTRLLVWYRELATDLDTLIAQATGPHALFHAMTRRAGIRLSLTRRLLTEAVLP